MHSDAADRFLDQAERALPSTSSGRRQSETSFLQGLLGELGHGAPAGLFRAALHNGPLMRGAQDLLRVLAMPSQRPQEALRAGDWMLRAVPGTGDVGHVSVLASDDLLTQSRLAAEGIAAESVQPGYYGVVIEAGVLPHSRVRPFARRLLDSCGRVPPHTVILRPRYTQAGAIPDFPPDEPEPDGVLGAVEQEVGLAGAEDVEYEQILERIRQELNLRFRDPNDPGLIRRRRRLRDLFTSVPGPYTKELHARLGARPTGDQLSGLFHGRLATATRRELLKILEDRFPADKAPAPSQPTLTTKRPDPGRIYEFVRDLLKFPSTDSSGFKKVIDSRFLPRAAPCGKDDMPSAKKGCSYSALIVGEWSHDNKGEQDLALEMMDFVARLFPSGSFALREETSSTADGSLGTGILTSGASAAATAAVTKRRGISAAGLRADDQFYSERWVPALVKGTNKLITYTGSAHTSKEYSDHFKKALPRTFDMWAGKPILNSVRDTNRRGLVLVVNMADEILEDFEIQAHREKLLEFPEVWMFENWLAVLKFDWIALFSSFKATTIYKLAEDLYWVLVPPYSGLRFDRTLEIAWSDPRVSDRIRRDRSWTLYDISKNKLRFEDDHKKGKHFLSVEVDIEKERLARAPTEENY